MNNPAVFIREPLIFKNKIKVYPPSVRDVVGNPKFAQFLKVLTISQEDIQDELAKKNESNDGNIGIFLKNNGTKEFKINIGDRIGQGAFMPFLVSDNGNTDKVRKGGYGSTGK